MKKMTCLLLAGALLFNFGFAQEKAELSILSPFEALVQEIDTRIKAEPQLLDQYITAINSLQSQQTSKLETALLEHKQEQADTIVAEGALFQKFASHLYDKKEEQLQKKATLSGNQYTFKSQALMPRLSISRGDKDYYTFPSNATYLQLHRSHAISGDVSNSIAAEHQGKVIMPKYYYAGENTLRDLGTKEKAATIHQNDGSTKESYLFFDFPNIEEKEMKNLNFKLGDSNIKGSDLFIRPTFSLVYSKKEMDKGFAYCKAVAERKGASVSTKEYAEKECLDAANLNFYPEMHEDILEYAKHQYWK